MNPIVIVPIHELLQSGVQFRQRFEPSQVSAFVLRRPPEPLNVHVVQPSSLAIHAVFRYATGKHVQKSRTRVLASLIRVEKLRLTVVLERLVKAIDTKIRVHRVGQSPRQNHPAEPIDNGRQVRESVGQTDVRDVRRPDVIRVKWNNVTQQIRVLLVFLIWNGRFSFRISRDEMKHSHQSCRLRSVDTELDAHAS